MISRSSLDIESYSSMHQWKTSNPSINNSLLEKLPPSLKSISLREILDKYDNDPELLKYILKAKTEEDKKSAAKDILKTQEVRIQLKQMDIDIAREQTKVHACYEYPPFQAQYVPFYKLSPFQQQVMARFSYPHQSTPNNQYSLPPPSPVTLYPHSAHPLCLPNSSNAPYVYSLPNSQVIHQIPIQDKKKHLKRSRYSVSNDTTDKQSHIKVIEALKAKIRRGSTINMSPIKETTEGVSSSATVKRQEQSFIPLSPSSLSPTSAKSHLLIIETQSNEKISNYCNNVETISNKDSSSVADTTPANQRSKSRRARSLSPCPIKNT